MRHLIWFLILAAASPLMLYGCDRAARATEMTIWELQLNDGTVISFGDMNFKECTEQLRLVVKTVPEAKCIPSIVQREES